MEFYFSDLNIKGEKDILLFKSHYNGLIDINVDEIENERIEITSKEDNFNSLDDIDNLNKADKFLIVHKVIEIIKSKPDYLDFSIEPSNIYMNSTSEVKIFNRYIQGETKDYMKELKALSLTLVNDSDFDVELNSDIDNAKFDFKLGEVSTIDDLDVKIVETYEKLKTVEREKKVLVNKKAYNRMNSTKIAKNVVIVLLLVFIVFFYFYFYSFQAAKANAYGYYLKGDYSNVIEEINKYGDSDRLTDSERVMLTISIINNQDLTDSQIELLSEGVNEQSQEEIFLYWNSIASKDYEDAIEKAQILEIPDLEIFACWLYIDYLKVSDMDSDEKVELINQYTEQADSLIEQRSQDAESAFDEEVESENSIEEALEGSE